MTATAALLLCTVADAADIADYSIAAIEYAPTPMQQVGNVKAGLICLPKGKLRWRDVARPGDHALVGRVESLLREHGLTIAPQPDPLYGDPSPATKFRIAIELTEAKLRLCVAGDVPLVGKVGRAPSTHGTIAVRWETYDRAARKKIDSVTFMIPIDDTNADARTASHVLSNAIEASAVRYAARRLN